MTKMAMTGRIGREMKHKQQSEESREDTSKAGNRQNERR